GLSAPVTVYSDDLAVPSITAASREDAQRVLGYLHARDRLFQMEVLRRKSAGRLAELFGESALTLDRQQRSYGFEQAARTILASLPPDQRRALEAYAMGVNGFIEQAHDLPPEFIALGFQPAPWRLEDSLLVALGVFQILNGQEQDERMLSVMEKALPPDLFAFLTPDVDSYTTVLLGGPESRRPARPIPARAFAALGQPDTNLTAGGVDSEAVIAGSNNWVVSGAKTRDGRAIVANDMHLRLGLPNIWYRACLRYAGRELIGLTLPGLPMLVAGSNGRIAWGFTNVDADVLDLVKLELNPANPEEYRTPEGWRAFERRTETIRVKDGGEIPIELRDTVWGPVSSAPLLGQPVAVRWTALDPSFVDLGLLDMTEADTLEQAMSVMNRSGGPPQNVVLADADGRIAWTYLGRFPRRRGFDGSVSLSWAERPTAWDGFIPPEQLPRVIDPPEGYLATANNRTLGRDYPYVIGHNYAHGYRAYRIAERLRQMSKATEADLLELQLDTWSEFFEFYRQLALSALDDAARRDPLLEEAARYIDAWNGRMDVESLGIGLLATFRQKLAETVFAPMVGRCREMDASFAYTWRKMETPLRALLTERIPDTLPDKRYADWHALILDVLKTSAGELKEKHRVASLAELSWGKINRITIRHPFSQSAPALSWLLDMPTADSAGCSGFCVRILGGGHGATERMVISPDHPGDGILHMPAGQSGHPLSGHYRDQQPAWQEGIPLAFRPGDARHRLVFEPTGRGL
ncbi:MAG TPA: penicillin acylase family protein, partial [Methylococcaceae bacterium]|nr:penicillin acylase family protein [Methylococcaceae bacterium]